MTLQSATNQPPPVAAGRTARLFARDRAGSTIVEFALIALPLFMLILGVLEIGWGNFVQSRLDAAVQQASRQVMTGFAQKQKVNGNPMNAQQFRDMILCPKLPSFVKCADVYVNVATVDEKTAAPFDQFVNNTKNGLVPPDLSGQKNSYQLGEGKNYVVLQAAYPLPALTSVLRSSKTTTYNGKPVRLLLSTATFKNEPFPKI